MIQYVYLKPQLDGNYLSNADGTATAEEQVNCLNMLWTIKVSDQF